MFSPTGVPGLLVWLQASGIGVIAGSSVTYWQDLSTNGHNFSYTPGNSSTWHFPTYQTNIINSYPVVRFSGSQNLVDVGVSQIKLDTHNLSAFIVYSNSGNNYRPIFANDGSNFPNTINFIIGNSGNKYDFVCTDSNGNPSTVIATSGMAYNQFVVRSDRFRSTDNLFVQEYFGSIINSGSISLTLQGQDTYLGYSATPGYDNYFQGDIAEFILYDNAISETNASSVNQYLNTKYFSGSSNTTSSYTGPISTISGCFIWLEADNIGTTDGNIVTYWKDSSGSGNNVSFPTGSSGTTLPVYQVSSATFNNHAAVKFSSGHNQYLTTSGNTPSMNFASGDLSIFTVFRTNNNTEGQSIHSIDNANNGTTSYVIGLNHSATNQEVFAWGNGKTGLGKGLVFFGGTDTIPASSLIIRYDRFNPNTHNLEININGSLVASGSASTLSSTSNNLLIGTDFATGNIFDGDLAEILAYQHKLTDSELVAVTGYLYNKYTTATTPTSSTPPPIDPSITLPTDISGCYFWLRSTSIGITGVDGSPVQYWPDDSGSGNHVFVPAGSSGVWVPPTFWRSQFNGYPTVRWDSSIGNHYLQSNKNNSLHWSPDDFTQFCVYKTTDSTDKQCIYSMCGSGVSFSIELNDVLYPGDFIIYSSLSGVSYSAKTITNYDNSHMMVRHDRFRQGDPFVYFGRYGADIQSGVFNALIPDAISQLYVGYNPQTNLPFYGDIAEVITYARRLSDLEARQVDTYLINKYQPENVKTINLFTYAAGNSGINSNASLYMLANYSGSTSHTSLYIGTSSPFLSGTSLYAYSLGQSSGYFPLYVANAQHQFPPLNLYLYNGISSTGSFSLYTMSSRYNQNLFTTYISGSTNTYSNNIPLYLSNYSSGTQNSMLLYMSGTTNPSITAGTTLAIAGNSAGSSGVYTGKSLYLEGGKTYSSLPLYLQTTPINTNPSGSMPLFIGAPYITGVYTNSISLYLENNASGLNSFCKRMYIKGDGSLRDGLIASATMNLYLGNSQLTPTVTAGSGYFFDQYWSVKYFDTAYFSTYK